MQYIIYKYTSPSGKSYIGITSEGLRTRWTKHCRKARFGSTTNFHKAIRKYGEKCWDVKILESFSTEDKKSAYAKEQWWIDNESSEYNMDCGFGWNIADRSGSNNPMYGKLSGNAHKVSIKGLIFKSITLASEYYNVNRGTITQWIKSKENCLKLS